MRRLRVHALVLLISTFIAESAFSIINGSPVPTGAFNQSVALVYQKNPHNKGQIICSGTLIGPHTVLTAGHCIATPRPDDIPIGNKLISHLGVYIGDSPSADSIPYVMPTVMVIKGIPHPLFNGMNPVWDPGIRNNDFAILELEHDVDLNFFKINPSPLRLNTLLDLDEKIIVVGFGRTKNDGPKGLKMQTSFKITNLTDADFSFSSEVTRAYPWHGDSGGSAYFKDEKNNKIYLVGVTTFSVDNENSIQSYFQSFDQSVFDWISSLGDVLFD